MLLQFKFECGIMIQSKIINKEINNKKIIYVILCHYSTVNLNANYMVFNTVE